MDNYVGEIRMFAGTYAPQGWALCDGALLKVSDYQVLFAVLGTTYGGDGRSNFGLPDLRGRLPVGQGAGPGLANRRLAQAAGTETVALTVTEMPAHTHALMTSAKAATETVPTGHVFGAVEPKTATTHGLYVTDIAGLTPGALNSGVLSPAGGGAGGAAAAHDNVMPSMVINFIIALTGLFPTQN